MENNEDTPTNKETIEKAKTLLVANPVEGLRLYSTIVVDFSKEELEDIYESVSTISSEDIEIAHQKSFLLCKIIENKNSAKELTDLCFRRLIPMLESTNHELADSVFDNIHYSLEGFEHKKYGLLHIYLNNTRKISILDDFFYHFKDPKYVFDVLVRSYEAQGFRLTIDNLSNTISHFWSTARSATENHIRDLFSHEQFGMLAVKIMVSGYNHPYPIDLLQLNTKEQQLIAIKCICNYPHSIDKLLPIVLVLRNSTHKEVAVFLQTKLSELIFNGYHSSLLQLVEKNITKSTADKKFIAPLVKSSRDYENMKEFKNSVQDLSPWENERNLIDLYYRLEHETQATMMKDNRNDKSFLSMLKNTTIVRGNAWKHEDDDTVAPLHLIQSSIMVDSRAYKNPIAYEQKLENL
jgi:hypothetical protein